MIETLFLLLLGVGLLARFVDAATTTGPRGRDGRRTIQRGRRLAEVVPIDMRIERREQSDPVFTLIEGKKE